MCYNHYNFYVLQRVERELHGKQQQQQQQQQVHNPVFQYPIPQDQCPSSTASSSLSPMLNIDIALQQAKQGLGPGSVFPGGPLQVQNAFYSGGSGAAGGTVAPQLPQQQQQQPAFFFAPLQTTSSVAVSTLSTATSSAAASTQPIKFQSIASHSEVSQVNKRHLF